MNAVAVFIGRTEASAAQWAAGEVELRDAADECQSVAEAYGLVLGLGQDAVQWLMADAFRGVSDGAPTNWKTVAAMAWNDPGWEAAAREYHNNAHQRVAA